MGIDSKDNKDEGAGDQGIMFGYACKETEDLMPAPIHFSHKILRLMAIDRKNGSLKGIEPDSKSQVTMLYEENKPVKVTSVVISTQHAKELNQENVRDLVIPYINKSIPKNYLDGLDPKEIYINPTGQFIIEHIKKIINQNFDLSPRGIREMLKLNNPIYEVTSAYGHFGRKATNKGEFTWEKTDKVNLFKL